MSKKGRRNSIRSHSLQTHRKFCSDGWDLRGHLEGRAQQAILGEISIQRKLYSTECNMEIQNIERRNSEYALFESQRELDSQRHKLLDANQSMLNVRDSEWVMKDHLHQESHARCCREIGMLRNTREDMSIPGNVFDCQHARRDSDALCNDSRNLATLLGILGTEGIEKIESEEPLLSTPISCSQVRARLKSLNGGKCPMSMTNHAAGIATCAQGMTIPSYLSSEMHLQKIPWPNEISELDREFPSWRLREKRRISRSYCSGSRDQSNQLAEDLLNLKSITGKDFSDYEELDLMMAAELKWCYYIAHLIYEITERWAVTRQKGRKTLAPSGGRQLDFVQKETLAVFSTRMPRDAVRLCGKKWETQRDLTWKRYPLQHREKKEQTDVKSSNRLKTSPATGV